MQQWNGLHTIDRPIGPSSVAVGMFDGIHLGHRRLIEWMVQDARAHGRPGVVLTFDRHPAELLDPSRLPGYLTTPAQRKEILESFGVDHLVVARFDEKFRDLSPESFLRFVLKGVLQADSVFVGFDFRFGFEHAGNDKYLKDAAGRLDIDVYVLEPVLVDGEKASSSRIRAMLRDGRLDAALSILGHPYVLAGTVVEGQKLGRTIGFPTANIELDRPQVTPGDGIYACRVSVDKQPYFGAASVGVRPTVGGTDRTIEVYILDFAGDLYGKAIELEFVRRLRDELKFESLEDLTAQIARDVEQVRAILGPPGDATEF